jgi:hypothetical protein
VDGRPGEQQTEGPEEETAMPDPHLRAGDTDREAVAAALGTHMAAGRLTLAEYDERLARAYAARTYGDLAELTADLPAAAFPRTPAPPAGAPSGASAVPVPATGSSGPHTPPKPSPMSPWAWPGHGDHGWRAWLATSVTVLAIYLVISLASWDFNYFWPIWVIGPWGAALLAQRITSGGRVGDDKPRIGR